MLAKDRYPFDPFVDSLLGEKIMVVWKSFAHSPKELIDALLVNTKQSSFVFTTNATKQTLMVAYPNQIRVLISEKKYKEIGELLMGLADGSLTESKVASLDLTFELIEWLLTGFDIDEQIVSYFNLLFYKPHIIDVTFVENVRAEYVKELRG